MAKVQNEMATRITIDTVQAANSMQALRQAVSANTNSWKAMETSLKSAGDYQGAAAERVKGLTQSIELQKQRINELRERQQGLDQSTQQGAQQFVKLENQISQANKQMASYEAQLSRAKSNSDYYSSGLANLQQSYKTLQSSSKAYVDRLKEEHRSASATLAEYDGLKKSLSNLKEQYQLQIQMLQKVKSESGDTSNAYLKQKQRIDETATKIAEADSKMQKMQSTVNRLNPTGISRIDNSVVKVRDHASQMANSLKNGFENAKDKIVAASVATAAFGTAMVKGAEQASDLQKVYVENTNLAVLGGEKQASAQKNVNQMYKDGRSLSIKYGESQQSIAEGYQTLIKRGDTTRQALGSMQTMLQASKASGEDFTKVLDVTSSTVEAFGMKSSNTAKQIENTKTVANELAYTADKTSTDFDSLGVAMSYVGTTAKNAGFGLNQANAALGILSNNGIEADKAGTSLRQVINSLTSNAKTLSKEYGIAITDTHGKMKSLSAIFSEIDKKTKGMNSTDKNNFFKSIFGTTGMQGAQVLAAHSQQIDKLSDSIGKAGEKQNYIQNLANKNMKATKNSVAQFKQSANAVTMELGAALMPAIAKATTGMAKFLNSKEGQKDLKILAKGIGNVASAIVNVGTFAAKHTTAVKLFGGALIGAFAIFKTLTVINNVKKMATAFLTWANYSNTLKRALDLLKLAAGPAGWIVLGITAVIAGLVALYKHNKRFRDFVNEIASATKKGLKNVGKFFSDTWKSVTKGLSGFWSSTKKRFSNGWNELSRATKSGGESVKKWWDQTSTQTTRTAQNMFRRHKETFESGYKVIQDRTNTWKDFVSGRWDRLGDDTKKTAQDMYNFHRRVFGDLYNWLNDKTNGRLGDMLKAWKDKLGAIGDVVSGARDAIHKRFVDLVRGIISPFNSMLDGLRKGINWILEKVGASGIGGSWSVPMPSYANGTNDTHPGGLAIVNDGNTGHYREMYRLPNGQIGMFPATRNMIVPLPKGTSVLDGDSSYRLARILGQTPHYAGGIGSFFSGLFEKGKDILEDVDKILAHPIQFVEDVFKKFVNIKTPVKFAEQLVENVPIYIAKQMGNWIKKQFEMLANPGGAGVERWRSYIERDLKILTGSVDATKVSKLLRQIQTESGGNPTIKQQISDVNSRAGHPAQGLLQFIPSTFNSWALPGHKNILNGNDQILAAINALQHGGEGGWGNIGNGHGWAMGGLISQHGLYEVAENNLPEYVIPTDISKRSRANQLLGEVITQFSSESKAMGNTFTGSSLISSENEIKTLNSKFDRLLSLVTELIGVNTDQVQAIQDQGSLDMQQVYRKQARDMRMRQLGLGGA